MLVHVLERRFVPVLVLERLQERPNLLRQAAVGRQQRQRRQNTLVHHRQERAENFVIRAHLISVDGVVFLCTTAYKHQRVVN